MVSAAVAGDIVGIIGNIISFCLFLSPLPTFSKIIKNEAVEKFEPDPYIATVLNCMLWTFYGMLHVDPHSDLIITINLFGLYIELAYLAIFFSFADVKRKRKVVVCLVSEVIFMAIVILITILVLHGTTNRSLMVELFCNIFSIVMYVSPLTIMKEVITTKSVKYMPFTLSLANFSSGCIWTIYALIKFDNYGLVSNGVGATSGLLQLVLYAYYSKKDSKDEEKVEK